MHTAITHEQDYTGMKVTTQIVEEKHPVKEQKEGNQTKHIIKYQKHGIIITGLL